MSALDTALYSLDCHGQRAKNGDVATSYMLHTCLRDSRQATSQEHFTDKESQQLYECIANLDYEEVGVTVDKEVGVASDENSDDEEEDTRTLSQPFAFKIHYDSDYVHQSVKNAHASVCSGVVERLVELQQLTELHLSECPLTEVSAYRIQFGPAYNLKVLRLERLCLRRLHPSIGRLRSLQELSLAYNRLTDLPLTIRLLRNLRLLDITGNPFSRLPGAVYHLKLDKIIGLNECPLKNERPFNWDGSAEVWWRQPLGPPSIRDTVDTLQESSVQAAVGMDCWRLELPTLYAQRLTTMAETQDLCQGCLQPVRKLTIEHESLGYTIHAQVAMYCGVRNVPFSFIACSQQCLTHSATVLKQLNSSLRTVPGFARLPSCDYELEFVQDLEEFRRQKAQNLLSYTHERAYPSAYRNGSEQSKCGLM